MAGGTSGSRRTRGASPASTVPDPSPTLISRCMASRKRAVTGRASRSAERTSLSMRGHGHVAVAVTNRRALGFSTYTGGFLILPGLRRNACCRSTEGQNAMVVRTSSRTVIFKSQSNGWTKCDSTHVPPSARTYIRPSSNSIASTQVEAGGKDATGTPRFVAISCKRP